MKNDEKCPHCGYCPHCGRADAPVKAVPYPMPYPYPVIPAPFPVYPRPYRPHWQVPSTTITCDGSISTNGAGAVIASTTGAMH